MSDLGMASSNPFLICHSGQRICGFPLRYVVETMRQLPVETLPDMPSFMAGVSIIRGATVPVVNLDRLLGETDARVTRFVSVKVASRTVAFAVAGVLGVEYLSMDGQNTDSDLPPLLGEIDSGIVTAIGIRDADLLSLLEVSRLIPESVWQNLDALDARGRVT